MRVAVVGAGITGLSAALSLAERGHTVTLIEQFDLFHTQGSSHGNSRIVRKAYPDPFYTEIMLEAYPLWDDLQERCSLPILHETGLLYYGMADSPNVISLVNGLADLGVEHTVEHGMPFRDLFKHFKFQPGEVAVFTPEAGWVHAANALRAIWTLGEAAGVQLRKERVEDISSLEREFDRVVICAGAWIRKFVDLPLKVSLQTFAYIEAVHEGPVWIEDSEYNCYGFPSEPGEHSIKIGVHKLGAVTDPDNPSREPAAFDVEVICDLVRRRFGVAEPAVTSAHGCLYTSTPDEDFRIGSLSQQTVYISACSGHGFKFGPWLGTLAADLAEGKKHPSDYPRFQG